MVDPSPLTALVGLNTTELEAVATALGEKPFRGRQLAKWIYEKAAQSFDEMADLPKALRQKLAETHTVSPLTVSTHRHSSDGVDKLLVHNGDGQVYECVLLPYADRVSCCLSSQVGCPMGCTFCATGLGGFDRNLTASEIVGQYLLLQGLANAPSSFAGDELCPKNEEGVGGGEIRSMRISHVVFMGMGEPLLNLDNLTRAMRILHDEVGLSYRHMTVSTVGLVPQIRELALLDLPIHLALSLHSPLDEVRNRLMPVNHKWPVAEVVQAMRDYQRTTGRKVTFEYLLIDGVNDTTEQAEALARLVKGFPCVVNLIPFNWVDTGHGFARPSPERVRAFRNVLETRKVNVTQRVERGHDIAAACGQLAGMHTGKFAKRRDLSPVSVSS